MYETGDGSRHHRGGAGEHYAGAGGLEDAEGYEYEYQEGQHHHDYYSGQRQPPGGCYLYGEDDPMNNTLGSIPEGEHEGLDSTLADTSEYDESAVNSPT
jgi:hypothetical protein